MIPGVDDHDAPKPLPITASPWRVCGLCGASCGVGEVPASLVVLVTPCTLVTHQCAQHDIDRRYGAYLYDEPLPSCGCPGTAIMPRRAEVWCGHCARLQHVADARHLSLPQRRFS